MTNTQQTQAIPPTLPTPSTPQTPTPPTIQSPKAKLRSPLKIQSHEAAESHQKALTILLNALDALILSTGKQQASTLLRVAAWVDMALADTLLSMSESGNMVYGLPPDFLQRLFRQVCQRGPGHELSRRQRSEWVQPFNRVGEALNKHLAVKLELVVNYNRAPRTLAIASRPNAFIPPSTYDRLMTVLLGDVFSETPASASVWFMRSALLIVFRLGVAFEAAVRQLCRLRVCDVRDDHIVVPLNAKRTRWLRVWLDPVTRVALGSLRIHHARRSGVRKRTLQLLSPLMHLATASEAEPDDKTLRRLRNDLNGHLAELCRRAKLPTYTAHELLPTVRWILAQREIYPASVIAWLAGQIETSVMPLDDLDADWTSEPSLPAAPIVFPKRVGVTSPHRRRKRRFDVETSDTYNAKSKALRDVLIGRDDTAADRAAMIQSLTGLVQQWMSETPQIDEGRNFTLLAAWLATLVPTKRIKTLRTYLGDALALIRYAGDSLINELGQEDVEAITEPDGRRHASVWQLWRAYLHQVKVPLAPLGKLRIRRKRETVEERLLPPQAVTELLAVLDGDAQVAAALGYYALARIDEVLSVRLCDLALLGPEPYLEIREGKGGKARRVYLMHASMEFIAWLRRAQTAVFRATDSNLSTAVRLCEPLIALNTSKLEKACKNGMRAIGRAGCTFHDLRKSRATALVIRGMDVRLVSRWLGHATVGVTWLSYVRTLDVVQREAVKRMVDDRELNLRQVAASLDVQPTSYLAKKLADEPISLQALVALVEVYESKKI